MAEEKGLVAKAKAALSHLVEDEAIAEKIVSEIAGEAKNVVSFIGNFNKKLPYALHIYGENQKLWEQPIGSGNMFNGEGQPLGNHAVNRDGSHSKVSDGHLDPDQDGKVNDAVKTAEALKVQLIESVDAKVSLKAN